MYTSIDLGSHSIKIIVSEKVGDKFVVLASTSVRSKGIKKGAIKDYDLALESLNEAVNNIKNSLGIEIKRVLLNFPLYGLNTTIETGEVPVANVVSGEDIRKVIKKAVIENIDENREVLYLEPIVFEIDSNIQVVDPKGLTTSKLKVRLAISSIEKEILYEYLKLLQDAGLEVDDICYGIVGDYVEGSSKDFHKKLGVVVNIGYSKTEIAVFNKGIMLKGSILPIGSSKLEKDISYIYKIDKKIATDLKETFAVASCNYSDKNDVREIENISGELIEINQFELSQIVEARLKEMIKNVKLEVNDLTNREISYIIVSGGVTNLTGFSYLMDEEFSYDKVICNITPLGIRSNIFSTCLGSIKYFDSKMIFRDMKYSMIPTDEFEKVKDNIESTMDNLITKFSNYHKD